MQLADYDLIVSCLWSGAAAAKVEYPIQYYIQL